MAKIVGWSKITNQQTNQQVSWFEAQLFSVIIIDIIITRNMAGSCLKDNLRLTWRQSVYRV